MKEIIYYNLSGEIKNRKQLINNIAKCDGMIKDYISLWTFDNLDEDKNQLMRYDNFKYSQTYIRINIEGIKK